MRFRVDDQSIHDIMPAQGVSSSGVMCSQSVCHVVLIGRWNPAWANPTQLSEMDCLLTHVRVDMCCCLSDELGVVVIFQEFLSAPSCTELC